MLEQPVDFTACSSSQFFNLFFVAYGTHCRVRGHRSHLMFCDLRDTRPGQVSLFSSLTFPTQPVSREAEVFPRGGKFFDHVPLRT